MLNIVILFVLSSIFLVSEMLDKHNRVLQNLPFVQHVFAFCSRLDLLMGIEVQWYLPHKLTSL
jgi:hypothetical protein